MKIVHYTFRNPKIFPSIYKGFSGFLFSNCQTRDLIFDSLEKLEIFMCQLVMDTTPTEINSICRYTYIFSDTFWTAI